MVVGLDLEATFLHQLDDSLLNRGVRKALAGLSYGLSHHLLGYASQNLGGFEMVTGLPEGDPTGGELKSTSGALDTTLPPAA